MLLILLHGGRLSESDIAAATVYTKFKERGVEANLVLSDLTDAGKYGYYFEDFFDGMKEVLFSRNEDAEVCIMNIPYIYHPSLRSGEAYKYKQKDSILYNRDYLKLRRRVFDLLEEDGHDILEYILEPDECNSKALMGVTNRNPKEIREEKIAKEAYDKEYGGYKADEEDNYSHSIYNIPTLSSNPIKWNDIFADGVCVLQGWDSYGI